MKRLFKWIVFIGAGLTGASLFSRRRKQTAWEDEPRGAAEFPPLQMQAEPVSAPTVEPGSTGNGHQQWVAPLDDGNCPLSHPVKVKERSGIYHVDGNIAYERTNADRCYASGDDAETDGYRAAKS